MHYYNFKVGEYIRNCDYLPNVPVNSIGVVIKLDQDIPYVAWPSSSFALDPFFPFGVNKSIVFAFNHYIVDYVSPSTKVFNLISMNDIQTTFIKPIYYEAKTRAR